MAEPSDHVVAETLARAARSRRIQQAVIGISLLIVVSFATVSLVKIQQTADYLKECTTPSTDVDFHRCYEDGQRRTQEAVQAIVDRLDYNAALQVCLLSLPPEERTAQYIEDCERKALESLKGEP